METGTKVKLIAILIIIGAIGGMVWAVTQSNFSIKSIDDVRQEGGNIVVDFTIQAENPTFMPVYVTSGKYNLYIEDSFIGEGSFGEVWMMQGNSTISCTQNIESLSGTAAVQMGLALLGLGSVTIKLEITELAFFFIKQEMQISQEFEYSA